MFSYTFRLSAGLAVRLATVAILIAMIAGVATAQVTVSANPSTLTAAAQVGGGTQTLPVTLTASTGLQVAWQAYLDLDPPSWLGIQAPGNGLTGTNNLNVTINPAGLAAGSYSSNNLKVYLPAYGTGTTITIPVNINVGTTGTISVNTNSLTFTATAGGSNPLAQTVQVSTASATDIVATTSIIYTTGSGWLSVTPTSGTLRNGSPLTLNVSAAVGSLGAATYTGTVRITSGASTQDVSVSFNVQAGSTISASPNPVYLTAQTGGSNVTQNVTVTNLSASQVTVTPSISAGSGWLSSTGSVIIAGSSSAIITLTASPSAGTQTGQLTLTPSTGSAINVPVYLTVSSTSLFTISKTSMQFNTSTSQLSDSVLLTNSGLSQITYATQIVYGQASVNWLSVNPSTGGINAGGQQSVSVSASASGLATAGYTATITFTPTGGGSAQSINVAFSVGGAVTISANPTTLTINAAAGQSGTAQLQISSTNSSVSIAPQLGASVYCTSPSYQYCATISPASAVAQPGSPATFNITSYSGLASGSTYTVNIKFASSPDVGMITVPLTINAGFSGGGGVTATPNALSFSGTPGGVAQSSQLYLFTASTGSYNVSSNQGWLTVGTQGSSFTSVFAPGYLSVWASPATLSAGTYYGTITITGPGGTLLVSVTFTVGGGGTGGLTVTPATLSFSGAAGSGLTALQSVGVFGTSTATYSVQATTQTGGSWIVLSQTFGQTGTSFNVQANASGLAAGTYYGSLAVTTSPFIGSQTINVTFTVGGGGGGGGQTCTGGTTGSISVSPNALQFTGDPGGALPAAQSVTLSTGSPSVDYSAAVSATWLFAQPTSGTVTSSTSRTMQIQVNPANLTTGTYYGSITITSAGGQTCVSVTFVVGAGGGGGGGTSGLTASPSALTMSSPAGSTAVVQQSVLVSGTSGLSFSAYAQTSSGFGWLSVTPTGGTSPQTLLVQGNPTGLSTGSYQGNVLVTTYLGTLTIPVVFNVGTSGGFGNLTVSPTALSFSAQAGGSSPASQTLFVNSTTGFSQSFSTSVANAAWLSLTPASGFTPASLSVLANPAGMAAGTYYGTINIIGSDGFSQQMVQVTLTLSSANLSVTPATLAFTAPTGGTAAAQTLSVSSALGAVQYTAAASTTTGVSWLSVSPTSGTTSSSVAVNVNTAGLSAGTYNGNVTFNSGVGTATIPVTLTVTQAVNLAVSPESLTFEAVQGATSVPTKTFSVTVSSGSLQFTVTSATSTGGAWVQATPASGTTTGTVTVTVNPTGLNPGVYNGTVSVAAAGASNSPRAVQVTLTITSAAPVVTAVVNAAAGTAGILSAGTIVTIYGRVMGPDTGVVPQIVTGGLVPTEAGGVKVYYDGIAGPILYAQARQVNSVVPWGLFGRTTVRVEVEYKGVRSTATQVQLYDAAPAIFSIDASGTGPGAILNQDGSVNSSGNGAAGDTIVSIYATGMGLTDPLGVDGSIPTVVLPKPVLPVSVLIGNTEAEVTYAGAAPYLVSGAMQVNVRIPRGLQPGVYAVTLRLGRFTSQLGLTIVVK